MEGGLRGDEGGTMNEERGTLNGKIGAEGRVVCARSVVHTGLLWLNGYPSRGYVSLRVF